MHVEGSSLGVNLRDLCNLYKSDKLSIVTFLILIFFFFFVRVYSFILIFFFIQKFEHFSHQLYTMCNKSLQSLSCDIDYLRYNNRICGLDKIKNKLTKTVRGPKILSVKDRKREYIYGTQLI